MSGQFEVRNRWFVPSFSASGSPHPKDRWQPVPSSPSVGVAPVPAAKVHQGGGEAACRNNGRSGDALADGLALKHPEAAPGDRHRTLGAWVVHEACQLGCPASSRGGYPGGGVQGCAQARSPGPDQKPAWRYRHDALSLPVPHDVCRRLLRSQSGLSGTETPTVARQNVAASGRRLTRTSCRPSGRCCEALRQPPLSAQRIAGERRSAWGGNGRRAR